MIVPVEKKQNVGNIKFCIIIIGIAVLLLGFMLVVYFCRTGKTLSIRGV